MAFRMQEYCCENESGCGHHWEELIEFPAGVEPRSENAPERVCAQCGGRTWKSIGAPRVMNNSFVDGARAKKPGWKHLKEAAKLRMQRRNLDPRKRGDINKEISNLEKAASNKTDVSQ
jgi:hypothetical protein